MRRSTCFRTVGRALASLALAALLLVPVACDDDSNDPTTEPFSLEVEVRRPDRTPVEGLAVVVWNISPSLQVFLQDVAPRKRRAATRIQFTLPEESVCSLAVYDLEGRLVQTLLDDQTLLPGAHVVQFGFGVEFHFGVEVMRYELVVSDPQSGGERFRDENYMTIVHLDPARLQTRATDADGRWVSADPTMVPGLYELPTMTAVDESGNETGTFTLDSRLVIRVYDDQGRWVRTESVAREGSNRFELTWDESQLQSTIDGAPGPTVDGAPSPRVAARDVPAVPPEVYRLYQNSPNPFN